MTTERPESVLFSVDLEPNKDGSLVGVREAMEWFDRTVPRGTVFTTHRIATELPNLVAELSESFEVGVHVHPREFGHEHDQLAELPGERQRELIDRTRAGLGAAVEEGPEAITSFRAGRHSASEETINIVRDLGFSVDASVNVRYDQYLPGPRTRETEPFEWRGLLEVPTSYAVLPMASRCGLRRLRTGPLTATASTLREDAWLCPGAVATERVLRSVDVGSFYMHPYDATNYHDLEGSGDTFRERFEHVISEFRSVATTASDLAVTFG